MCEVQRRGRKDLGTHVVFSFLARKLVAGQENTAEARLKVQNGIQNLQFKDSQDSNVKAARDGASQDKPQARVTYF